MQDVEHQGDLTAFQKYALLYGQAKRNGALDDEQLDSPKPNQSSLPGGGGKKTEQRSFTNLSAKTGKSPEELIAEYRAKHADSDSDSD